MAQIDHLALLVLALVCLLPTEALAQGETTSAIVGEVRDAANAVVPGATVTIANSETGLRRSANGNEGGTRSVLRVERPSGLFLDNASPHGILRLRMSPNQLGRHTSQSPVNR